MRTIENSVIVPVFMGICLAMVVLACLCASTVTARARIFRKLGQVQYGSLANESDDVAGNSLRDELDNYGLSFKVSDSEVNYSRGGLINPSKLNLSVRGESTIKLPFFRRLEEFIYSKTFTLVSPSFDLRESNMIIKGEKVIKHGVSGK